MSLEKSSVNYICMQCNEREEIPLEVQGVLMRWMMVIQTFHRSLVAGNVEKICTHSIIRDFMAQIQNFIFIQVNF